MTGRLASLKKRRHNTPKTNSSMPVRPYHSQSPTTKPKAARRRHKKTASLPRRIRHNATRNTMPTTAQQLNALHVHQQPLLPHGQQAVPQLSTIGSCRVEPQILCDYLQEGSTW